MAKLTTKRRKALPSGEFALPGKRAYPIYDKSHARNALSQVAKSSSQKNLTPAEVSTIKRKACAVLNDKVAGAAKACIKRNRGT